MKLRKAVRKAKKPKNRVHKKAPKSLRTARVRKPMKRPHQKGKRPKIAERPVEEVKAPVIDKQMSEKIALILADSYIRQMLIELGGENALAIVRNFYGNHSDEELAKKLKLKISDVRATLNKLHNEGLVNYIREKDNETGWYSYSWSLNVPRIERWAGSQNSRLGMPKDGATVDYYFCASCGASTITGFEAAANDNFRCERCNRLLEFIDEKRILELYDKKR